MSQPMKPGDPAYWMLFDEFKSTPTIYKKRCYICEDPEFAQMGLPLCFPCMACGAHVAADDDVCENGHVQPHDLIEELEFREKHKLEITEEFLKQVEEYKERLSHQDDDLFGWRK